METKLESLFQNQVYVRFLMYLGLTSGEKNGVASGKDIDFFAIKMNIAEISRELRTAEFQRKERGLVLMKLGT